MVLAALLLAGSGLGSAAAAPVGIPKELAVERKARVSELRYGLSYTLVPHAPTTAGVERLQFVLKDNAAPLLLDFRDGTVDALAVNGAVTPVVESNGHLVLPASALKAGGNAVEVRFHASVAPAEKAITRFEDKDDGSEYIYTLFVPMDASMAFPCFDQPDLKARFQLELTAPAAWTVISNTNPVSAAAASASEKTTRFGETEPISTYLFSYAAGPFEKVHPVAGLPGLYVRRSKAKQAESEAPEVQQMAADGMKHLAAYFAQPFPFPKYDMVLIPGFAFGGMEHAGSTFLREESVLFRTAPTKTNLFNRDIVVLHELTHQWFGDFTTMRWFDDLWLKEGFAQYMAYQTLATLHPEDNVWKRFYESIKPGAYGIDETQGTTPIYQDIANLKDAKSAYGAIVYSKAPGVIKQLAFVLGEENFRNGLRLYLSEHKYGNAQWSDLVGAFERVSGQSLGPWAEMWIRHRGMPRVEVSWSCAAGKIAAFRVSQRDVLGGDAVWPIASEAKLEYADGTSAKVSIRFDRATAEVPAAVGQACPAYVFANEGDEGYGMFLLDATSRAYVMEHVGAMPSVFDRALLLGSLWESVRQAELAPRAYLDLALQVLPVERDEAVASSVLDHAATALHRYVDEAARGELTAKFASLAAERMMADPDQDLRIVWFRRIGTFGQQEAGRATVKALLKGTVTVPGVTLRQQDRWGLVTTLIAYGDPEADTFLAEEAKRDASGDGKKFAYIADAARPDAATKKRYFDEYLHDPERSEDWIQGSLGAFNFWNQTGLSQPYLVPALGALDQIKRQRKIFFLVGWLDAFIDGQVSEQADAEVHGYLKGQGIDHDLRLKILEAVDELDRTVKIRKRWGVRLSNERDGLAG